MQLGLSTCSEGEASPAGMYRYHQEQKAGVLRMLYCSLVCFVDTVERDVRIGK